ncbi:MAG TPA: DUF6659 family protein [Nitrososphaeraceae archaeon]|nr:DUF6659 family protein [Nitrososphaeraceae archaeon]
MIDDKFLYRFSKDVLRLDPSIRWVGIADNTGVLLNAEHREGVKLLLSDEENEEYASNAIKRHKTRTTFESKLGKMNYALGRYEGLTRATIPINNNYYLLITLDVEAKDYDTIIIEKVIPFIEKEKEKFFS